MECDQGQPPYSHASTPKEANSLLRKKQEEESMSMGTKRQTKDESSR
jgi:hypothetical protein